MITSGAERSVPAAHSYLAVTGAEVTVRHEGVPRAATLLVAVEEYGPGAQVGLLQGDVVLRAYDRDVRTGEELRPALHARSSGADLRVEVLPAGQPRALTVALGQRAA